MRLFDFRSLLRLVALLCANTLVPQGSMVGVYEDYILADTFFTRPYIDVDEWRDTPVRHRYIHGGFGSNTSASRFICPPRNGMRDASSSI